MSVTIKKVESKKDLKAFVAFQFDLYKGSKYWIPPLIFDEYNTLRKDRNPAFEDADAEYWIAYKDGKPAGRIACIINNKAIAKWGAKNARFGWVDFIDDREVSAALFSTAEAWAKSRGMEAILGPMGFTDLDKEGMLIEGFEELGTMPMIYNYAYYKDHLEALGYGKDVDWLEFEIVCPKEIPEKILRINDLVLKRSHLRLANPRNRKELIDKYGRQFFDILEEAYAELYGTVPLSQRQVDSYIKQYLGFVDLRYTKIIIDEKGDPVGFGLAMPSLSRGLQKARGRIFPLGWLHIIQALRKPLGLDLYLIAVRKDFQNRGLNALLMTEITRNAIEDGVKTAESAGELESNDAVQGLWNHFEKRQHKRRRAFIKKLA